MNANEVRAVRGLVESPFAEGNEKCASHIFVCDECANIFRRRLAAEEFAQKHCRDYEPWKDLVLFVLRHPALPFISQAPSASDWRMVAAKAEGKRKKDGDDEPLTLVFLSIETGAEFWIARLVLPPSPVASAMLPLEVKREGGEEAKGVFHLCGKAVPLKEGRGEISYADFVKGLADRAVRLETQEGVSLPGTLVLFND